ncbi:MAG: hypothetical protein M1541_00035 [Acidobacteria bacterium]|nr:hypothetical protein [Acidobacteriota bacterium]
MRRLRSGFVRACAVFSLLCGLGLAAQAPPPSPLPKAPLLVVLNGDAKQWEPLSKELGWRLLTPVFENFLIEKSVKGLESEVSTAANQSGVDSTRVYLLGRGAEVPAVFFLAARVPHLWAAALALGGTPRAAIDSNRLFAINTRLVPVLWIAGEDNDDARLLEKLNAAKYSVEMRQKATPQEIFSWLASHHSDPFPQTVDCETETPSFPRCYWVEMTKFDATERNDVLGSTRVQPGSGASLDLGGFGFDPRAEGPGVLVAWLPDKYQGPLKLNDRIVSVGGKEIRDARAYVEMMEQITEEKPVAIMLQRGNNRMRVETRIVLPKPEGAITARVQGRYVPDLKEIEVLSRTVTQLRLNIPEFWTPAGLNWNGTELTKADAPGCWLLTLEKEVPKAQKCP